MSKPKKYELNTVSIAKVAGGYNWDDPDSLSDPANPEWITGTVILNCEYPLCNGRLTVRYIHNGNGIIMDYQPYARCPVCGRIRSIKQTDIEYPYGAPA